jgi:hypothetical protein
LHVGRVLHEVTDDAVGAGVGDFAADHVSRVAANEAEENREFLRVEWDVEVVVDLVVDATFI